MHNIDKITPGIHTFVNINAIGLFNTSRLIVNTGITHIPNIIISKINLNIEFMIIVVHILLADKVLESCILTCFHLSETKIWFRNIVNR